MISPALLAAVLVAVAVLIILVVVFLGRRKRQGSQRPVMPPLASTHSRSTTKIEAVSPQTQEILLKLLNGDRTTAERLVQNVRNRNPGKSENWCWEKVISDIERDRR